MASQRDRREWGLLAIILLLGILLMCLAGQVAIRLSPRWQVDANLESKIDPASSYEYSQGTLVIEPLRPEILTPPVWPGILITPATTDGGQPADGTTTVSPDTTPSPTGTFLPSPTNTATPTVSPTNTTYYWPLPTATHTPQPPSPGRIVIVKNTAGGDGTFNFTSSRLGGFSLTTAGGTASRTFAGLTAGAYNVAETVPAGWDLTGASCSDGSPVSAIALSAGETVTCTFTNARRGSITIVKNTVGGDATFGFTSATLGNFNLVTAGGTASQAFANLLPGAYTVSEDAVANWLLTGLSCADPDGGSSVNPGTHTAAIDLDPGEDIACTFTNGYNNFPGINFGNPDGSIEQIPNGQSWTSSIPSPGLAGNGSPAWDLVYFELAAGSGIYMDFVHIQVSVDGSAGSWVTIFHYGGGVYSNSSIADCPEADNTNIPGSPPVCGVLIDVTGVGIDIDALGLTGPYHYIRITAEPAGVDANLDVNSIRIE